MEAYCEKRKDRRMFKLTRIREHFLVDEESISIEGKAIDVTPIYEQVVLTFHSNQLGKLYDFFLEEEIEIQNNLIKVTFKYNSNRNLIPFLLMFGSTVDVIKPQTLKQQYYNELNKIHKKINDDNQLSYIP